MMAFLTDHDGGRVERRNSMDSDHLILERVKQGDINAFSTIVQRHQKAMLFVVLRVVGDLMLAEDVVQEAFIKAFQKIESFQGRSKFKSWLFQIAINTAKNRLRSMRSDVVDIDKVSVSHAETQETDLSRMDLHRILNTEIESLPPKQKLALSLRIYDDMSFAEIAEVMDCPYDTAKANYRHALLKLRDKLGSSLDLKGWSEDRTLLVEAER
jgi:RNA polymerase sigma-70 factor, ECF subfamily